MEYILERKTISLSDTCQTHSALALPRAVCFVEGLGISIWTSISISQSQRLSVQLLGQEVRFELLLSV